MARRFNEDNRGQAQYLLESAFRLGFLMVALLAFFLLVNFFIINKVDTKMLQAEVTANRIIYSGAITYQDDFNSFPGIIDADKFSTGSITSYIDYPVKRHATAKLEIIDNADGKVAHTAYLNEEQFNNLKVLVESGATGKGSATEYVKNYPVTYKKDDRYIFGTLVLTIIVPNS